MEILNILIYIVSGLLLFFIIQLTNKKSDNNYLSQILISLVYIIIISGIFKSITENVFVIILIELLIRMIYTSYILEKKVLLNKDYVTTYLVTIITSYILNVYFINNVDSVFLTAEELKPIIWVLIILFIYTFFKTSFNWKSKKVDNINLLTKKEYIVVEYAKLKNKYFDMIKPKNKDLIPIIYAIMVYENYQRPYYLRKIDNIKFHLTGEKRNLGIMQVATNKMITDEESINIVTKKLEKIIPKSKSKSKKQEEIISSYEKNKIKAEIIKEIHKKIVEFNEQ